MSLSGLREDRATLSGVASETTLVLPATATAISVGGDFGTAGMVLGKDNITNVLYWDTVTGATIPPDSIDGSKLKSNINIITTGDITANQLTLTSNTTALDFTGTGEIVGKAVSLTSCRNLDLSDTSNVVPTDAEHEDITFYKSLTGTNGDGGPTTFMVDSLTGNTTTNGILTTYGTLSLPTTETNCIDITGSGIIQGNTTTETICKNLDLSDTSNIVPTDAEHEDIVFYKSLTGKNGILGATTFSVDSTTSALQLNRDDLGNTIAYRNIEGHITGTANSGTTTYTLTASNGNFTCSDIDFIGGLNGRAVIGLESVATSINLLDATNVIGNPEVIVIADATNPGIVDSQTFASSFVAPVWGDLVASNRLNLSFRARELKQSFSCSFFYEYMNTGASVVVQLFFRLYDVTAGAGITETERAFVWHTITSPPSAIRRQITINGYLDNYFSLLATKVLKPQLFCFAPSGAGHTFSVMYGGNIGIGNGVALPHAEFRIKDMPPSTKATINMAN